MGLLREIKTYIKNRSKNIFKYYMWTIAIIALIFIIIMYSILVISINNLDDKIDELNIIIEQIKIDNSQLADSINNNIECVDKKISNISIILDDISEDNNNLKYSMDNTIPDTHSDIGIKIMLNNNIDPVLLFSVINARSGGDLFDSIDGSTAKGYGLMIKNTAMWVYEDIMGKKNYTHAMQDDGSRSMEILAEYLVYLMDIHSGNIERLSYSYIGYESEDFYNSIKVYVEKHNSNVINMEYDYIRERGN